MAVKSVEALLEHTFTNKNLITKALTHPSLAKASREDIRSYERLEFLGDAVLGLILAEFLWKNFPDEQEGGLAKRHSVLVSGKMLSVIGNELNIGEYIQMTDGEEQAGGRQNKTNIENVIEALIGALYLDGGLEAAEQFISKHWFHHASEMVEAPQDPKTRLQEWIQGHGKPLPVYKTVSTTGPSHAPTFVVEVEVEGQEKATGQGPSKKRAEREAARALLTQIFSE